MRTLTFLAHCGLILVIAAPAQAGGRVLTASDVVSIRFLDAPELNLTARVAPDGTIAVPYVGRIKAAGLTQDEVAEVIEKRLIERKILVPHP